MRLIEDYKSLIARSIDGKPDDERELEQRLGFNLKDLLAVDLLYNPILYTSAPDRFPPVMASPAPSQLTILKPLLP